MKYKNLPDLLTALRRVTGRYGRSGQVDAEEMCDLCAAFDPAAEALLERALTYSASPEASEAAKDIRQELMRLALEGSELCLPAGHLAIMEARLDEFARQAIERERQMSEIWEVHYRDGRTEQIECSKGPVELTFIATGEVFAVQVFPVEGDARTFKTDEIARLRKVS